MAKYVAPSDLENLVELAISNSVKIEALLQLMVGKGVFAEQEITDKIQELRRKLPRRNRSTEDVLNDIDDLLEESAEEFLESYVQKPGFRGDDGSWCGESHVMSKKPPPSKE